MNIILQLIDPLFYGLVILQLAALFFFGIAAVLRRLTPEPVERIRITMTAFCAIPVLFAVIVTPFVPRWSIAIWHESPTIGLQEQQKLQQQVQSPAETTSPMILPREMPQPLKKYDGSEEIAMSPGTQIPKNTTEPAITTMISAETPAPTSPTSSFSWLLPIRGVVTVGFFAVSLAMIVFHLVALVRLRRIMQTTISAPDGIEKLFRDQVAGCRNTVKLRVSPRIDSPLLIGLFRPVILLPVSMTREENAVQTRYALAHEWAHHQNGDLWTWCFAHACRLLFWAQPFYWHLAKELRVDQDFLTDDTASRTNLTSNPNPTLNPSSNTDAEQYAFVLVELAKRRIMNALIGQLPALGFADTPTLLTRRIEMLLKEKARFRGTSRRFWLLTICGLFFGLAVTFGTVRFTKTAAEEVIAPEPQQQVAEQQPAVDSSEDEVFVELRLLVVDDEQKPVPGAKVELRYSDWMYPIEQYWETDADGMVITKISQRIIDPEKMIQVYHKERGLVGRIDFPVDKAAGIIVDPMEVTCKLKQARRLTGQVLDQDDKPVEGAIVGGTWSYRIGCDRTDDQGHFTIDALAGGPLQTIFAFKPGVGYDSLHPDAKPGDFYKRATDESWRKEKNRDNGPFTFKLDKGKPITVKVVDMEGNPIEGVLVSPVGGGVFYENHILETNCFESLMGQKTDKDGLVVFDWLPSWCTQASFYASGSNPRFDKTGNARFYGSVSGNYNGKDEPLVISLPKRVEIQGSVRLEDGSPVPWRQLHIHGKNFATVGEFTDHAGNISYDVNAGDPIIVLPDTRFGESLVAPAIHVESVGDGLAPVPRFDFVLKKGTKLSGRVTSPETGEPVPEAYIQIYEMTGPDDTLGNHFRGVSERYAHADKDGNYSVQLPPGLYRFVRIGLDGNERSREIPKPLEVKGEEEIRRDF